MATYKPKLRDAYTGVRSSLLDEIERVEWEMREGKMLPHPQARTLIQHIRRFVGKANEVYEKAGL